MRTAHSFRPSFIHSFCQLMAIAPHSSTLAWKIPWMEEPGRLQSMGLLRVGHNWAISLSCIGEGNGNPLQYFCLENLRDGGACWAAVYGVSQSWTWLKWLSSSSSSQLMELPLCTVGDYKQNGKLRQSSVENSKNICIHLLLTCTHCYI